jgi:hypothetical protein
MQHAPTVGTLLLTIYSFGKSVDRAPNQANSAAKQARATARSPQANKETGLQKILKGRRQVPTPPCMTCARTLCTPFAADLDGAAKMGVEGGSLQAKSKIKVASKKRAKRPSRCPAAAVHNVHAHTLHASAADLDT